MGKGDRKTFRGKINRSSYGNSRAHDAGSIRTGVRSHEAETGKMTPVKAGSQKKPV